MIKKLILVTLIALGLGSAFWLGSRIETAPDEAESLLSKIPDVSVTDVDSNLVPLSKFLSTSRPGIIFVHFWATWCGPCEAELPDLVQFAESKIDNINVTFLIIAVNDELPKIKKRVKQLSFKNTRVFWLIDNSMVHRDRFGVTKIPETFVFSSSGQFKKKLVGPQEWTSSVFDQLTQSLSSK